MNKTKETNIVKWEPISEEIAYLSKLFVKTNEDPNSRAIFTKTGVKMNKTKEDTNSLEFFSKCGVLPNIVSQNGLESEPILSCIICSSITPGKDRKLPKSICLIYRNNKGEEERCAYSLIEHTLVKSYPINLNKN